MIAALPGGRARRRRRDHRRRHRLDRPHRRDRREPAAPRVLHHEWDGDFSAARNVSFEAATGDWVMYLDADEVLVADDAERLRALAGRTWREAFFLTETNHTGDLEDGTAITHDAMRLFRNRPEYRFEGRIHEQIAQSLPALPARAPSSAPPCASSTSATWAPCATPRTSRAATSSCSSARWPRASTTPFLHFNLGSEYAAAGDVARALTHFERAWTPVRDAGRVSSDGYAPALAARYVHALRNAGRLRRGRRRRATRSSRSSPASPTSCSSRRSPPAPPATPSREEALLRRCLEMGDGPEPLLGDRRLRHLPRARGRWPTSCAAAAPSTRPRRRCAAACSEHPGFLAAVDPYAARDAAPRRPGRRGRRDGPRARGRLDARACASCSPSR